MVFELTFINQSMPERPYRSLLSLVRESATGRLLLHERPWSFFWTLDAQETSIARGGGAPVTAEDADLRSRIEAAFSRMREGVSIKYLGLTAPPAAPPARAQAKVKQVAVEEENPDGF